MNDQQKKAFARLPSPGNYVIGHAQRVGHLATPAQFRHRCCGLAADDGGVDPGEELGHQRFTFFVNDQKIDSTVPPRNIAVEADSESQDGFSWHAAIVNGRSPTVNAVRPYNLASITTIDPV
jgi:hypothetical protein